MKNKSFIGISFIILVFGIWTVKEIRARYFNKVDLMEIGSAPSFSLTNQDGKTISNEDLKGKVHVVEFFFSTCPTICPIMNQNMLKIEKEFLSHDEASFAGEKLRAVGFSMFFDVLIDERVFKRAIHAANGVLIGNQLMHFCQDFPVSHMKEE